MVGPIGAGVGDGLRRARKDSGPPPRPASPVSAWLAFVLSTAALSWITAIAVGPPATAASAALHVGLAMLWPPLLAAWMARLLRDPAAVARRRAAPAIGLGLALALIIVSTIAGALEPATAAAATAVLALQVIPEEYGWRGVPLRCAIERWGERTGLAVHGLAWLAWVAPLVLLSPSW